MTHFLSHLALLLAAAFVLNPAQGADSTFAQPRADLFTGGQPTALQLKQLAADGIRTVIDLRTADEPRGFDEARVSQELGLRYVSLPIADGSALTPANAAALKRALAASNGPVLLHCASSNRVGGLLALMAADQEGLPAQEALDLGKRSGLKSLEPIVRERLGLPSLPASEAKP